jgi:ATP-binding cassette subfamily B protein
MVRFLKPVWGYATLAGLYLAISILLEVAITYYFGLGVDAIKTVGQDHAVPGFRAWLRGASPGAGELRRISIILSAFIPAFMLFRYLREVSRAQFSMNMVYYIREAIYDKLQRVGFAFHDAVTTGQLINRALSDLQNCRTFIENALLTLLEIVLVVLLYDGLLWKRSAMVALLALAPLPVWVWYILEFSRRVQPAARAVMEADDRNVSIIAENIAGVHVVKAFATEPLEIGKYNANADTFRGRVMARIRLFADFTPVIRTIGTASHLLLFAAVGVSIILGRLSAGDFVILATAMSALLTRLQQVAVINEQYQNAMVSAVRLFEVLLASPTVPEKADARPLAPGSGTVRFENVTFGYDTAKPVIHDVSFEIKGGSIAAIVGPTGAGKSTLISLIARYYDPQRGRVLIDGMDVRDTTLASLRTQVAMVFQETYLFSDTVEANIAYGRPGVTGGEVEAAARLAQAHEFIEQLPQGYQTMLGERGASLSGGQRQRLAIARAIVANPRVLVLDDATAAVDPETEDLIRRGMRFAMHGRTTFVIAHRISSVKRADVVIVVEDGRITQTGTHAELMATDGHYREIAAAQLHDEGSEPEGDSPSHMKRTSSALAVSEAMEAAKTGNAESAEEGV